MTLKFDAPTVIELRVALEPLTLRVMPPMLKIVSVVNVTSL
jgi:hypothetical protein